MSSHDGRVTAYNRFNGQLLWRLKVNAKIESSPVAIGRVVYFGATDGRLFAVYVRTGRVKWAYDTGGRINSSPSISGNRIFVSTYAGSIFCLRVSDGHKLWNRYFRRDVLRYESFYASPSTDGRRVFTIARSGKIYAVSASSGHLIWTARVGGLGYSTPAIAHGRVFIGGFDGGLRAFRASTGQLLWRRNLHGRILGGSFVAGNLVFTSTLAARTFAMRVSDGKILWRLNIGKYSPGIVTERHYFFTLNGIVMAWHATAEPADPCARARQATAGRKEVSAGAGDDGAISGERRSPKLAALQAAARAPYDARLSLPATPGRSCDSYPSSASRSPATRSKAPTSSGDICTRQSRSPAVGGRLRLCWCGLDETSTLPA